MNSCGVTCCCCCCCLSLCVSLRVRVTTGAHARLYSPLQLPLQCVCSVAQHSANSQQACGLQRDVRLLLVQERDGDAHERMNRGSQPPSCGRSADSTAHWPHCCRHHCSTTTQPPANWAVGCHTALLARLQLHTVAADGTLEAALEHSSHTLTPSHSNTLTHCPLSLTMPYLQFRTTAGATVELAGNSEADFVKGKGTVHTAAGVSATRQRHWRGM